MICGHSKHIPAVEIDGAVIADPWILCNKFGEYFASVYQKRKQNHVNMDFLINDYHEFTVISSPNIYPYN